MSTPIENSPAIQAPSPQMMQPQDPLANLRDIHLPDAIGLWPLAPGWWFVIIIASLLFIILFYAVRRYRQTTAFKRTASQQLDRLNNQCLEDNLYLKQLNQLLKQTALAVNPREDISRLNGKAWLNFLDRDLAEPEFSQGAGQALECGPYSPNANFDRQSLHALVQQWIKRQQRQC